MAHDETRPDRLAPLPAGDQRFTTYCPCGFPVSATTQRALLDSLAEHERSVHLQSARVFPHTQRTD